MRRLRNSLLAAALFSGLLFAQSAEELESPNVNRVAEKLLCPCGCKINMACRMEPYPCKTCWDNKKKILTLQQAGFSDKAILDQFAKEQGKDVVANPPGLMGSLSMYSVAILGLIFVVWVIRRYSRKAAIAGAVPADDSELNRYHDQIEKEVEKLD